MNGHPVKVLVVQQINRAYRVPLLGRLSEHPNIELTMLHGTNPPVQAGDVGISMASGPMPFRTISGPIGGMRAQGREVLWFGLALQVMRREFFDVVICDFYARLLSIWPMQSIQHRRNAGFILWGIGFHQYPTPILDIVRLMMIKRTDALLLYSNKESQQYQRLGVPPDKCFVIQNTVDLEGIDTALASVTKQHIEACRRQLSTPEGPVLLHVGRLAKNKRLDLLLQVLPRLQKRWPNIRLALIGEGPEHAPLQRLAHVIAVDGLVRFLGPITDHKFLAPWVLTSDLVVAPGQVGLLAPMSLAYKRTLVISNVSEHHGPEVQAFAPGETGMIYEYENLEDLGRVISNLLAAPEKCRKFAAAGATRVREFMGPERMLNSFLRAIRYTHEKRSFPSTNR